MPSTLPPATGARDRHVLAAVASLFVLSGFAALVYQVAWQRILALHTGVSVYSVALIVSAFMAGLGLGSHLGGLLSRRLDRVRALQAFALLELGVGLFAASSAWLYYDLLYVRGGALYAAPWRAALLHFAALLPPTTLMGMSLPLVARALVRDGASAARTLGLLYGLNVVGAALGAWLAPWLLIRELGLRQAFVPDVAPVAADTPISELYGLMVQCPCPLPVVDPNGRFLGAISKTTLLKFLDPSTDPHGNPLPQPADAAAVAMAA